MATRISLGPDAPKGGFRFGVGEIAFTINEDKSYETDSVEVVQSLQTYYDKNWLVTEDVDGDPTPTAAEEAAAIRELERERAQAEKADAKRVVKDPTADPVLPEHESHVEILEEKEADAEESSPKRSTTRKGAKS